MSAPSEATTCNDDVSAGAYRLGDALDALLLEQSERICELELQLEEQLDELSVAVESGFESVEERERALRRESEDIQSNLKQLARRETETRQQRRTIARQLRERKSQLESQAPQFGSTTECGEAPNSQETQFELAFLKEELETQRSAAEAAQRALAELESQLAGRPASGDDQETEDLRQRLELALDDIRELKEENRTLRTRTRQPAATDAGSNEGLDWEAQKARMLVQLEGEGDPADTSELSDEDNRRIRELESVLQQREQEICQLQLRLEQPRDDASRNEAAGDDQRASLLDEDELIREEREKLLEVQQEWREKLRVSEIEISVERAKLARERLQLEEQLQVLQRERDQASNAPEKPQGKRQETQGRWLARLGLSDK